MKTIIQDGYGSTAVLRYTEIDPPTPGRDDVLVKVHAAGVDAGAWHLMTGTPYPMRLGFGLRRPKFANPGQDFAGTVEAVGANVGKLKPGDEVFGSGFGAFTEYHRVPQNKVTLKPPNLTFEAAAASPTSALTALQALRDKGNVSAGQRVLVIGAGGGVGTFAVQTAKHLGAHVTAVTSKVDMVAELGADEVVDYTKADFTDTGYDVIIDIAGGRRLSRLRHALVRKGILVLVGNETGGPWLGGMDRLGRALLLSPFVSQSLRGLISIMTENGLADVRDLVTNGKVTPVIDQVFPLADTAAAIQRIQAGQARGKIVITML